MPHPPFMNASATITKALEKIKEAKTPDRFTQDFLATKLGFSGGGAKSFIPFAKRLGLLATDGTPTELYKQFRNPSTSKIAMAEAIKKGYSDIYERNEYAHELDRDGLEGLVMEITGLEKGNSTLRAIIYSFENAKAFADFDMKEEQVTAKKQKQKTENSDKDIIASNEKSPENISMGLSYIINLVLPKTDDIAVFNAIFKSLKDNLLRK